MLLSSCGRCYCQAQHGLLWQERQCSCWERGFLLSILAFQVTKGEKSAQELIAGHDICRTSLILQAWELLSKWDQQPKRRGCNAWQSMAFSLRPHVISTYQIMWAVKAGVHCQWPFSSAKQRSLMLQARNTPWIIVHFEGKSNFSFSWIKRSAPMTSWMDGNNYIHSLCLFTFMNVEHGKRYWKCHTHCLEMYEVNQKLMSGWRIGQELHKKNKETLTVFCMSTSEKHPNLYLNWTAKFLSIQTLQFFMVCAICICCKCI